MDFYNMTWLERLLFLRRINGGGGSQGHEETSTTGIFDTDMVAPLRKLLLQLNPIQSGSGDPSPDNVRPISGWDGVSVTRCGSNLRGGLDFANDVKVHIPSLDINTTDKTASFAYNASTAGGVYAPNVAFKENTRYTFIFTLKNPSTARSNLRIYYTDNSYTDLPDLSGADIKQTLAVVTTENKTVLTITRRQQGGTTILYYDECGVFEGVITADDFEPYAGQSYTTSLGQTVYGGTLDMVSGVLTVDRVKLDASVFDSQLKQGSGNVYVSSTFIYITLGLAAPIDLQVCACNCLKALSATTTSTPCFSISSAGVLAVNGASGITDTLANWRAFVSQNDVYFILKLREPQTYQLDPQEIKTLKGTNIILTDGTIVEVVYLKKAE